MINGLEGIPGSGKSYEAVRFQVLADLQQGYKVITNLPLEVDKIVALDGRYADLIEIRRTASPVRGTWDASRVDENGNGEAFQLFEDGHVEPPMPGAKPFSTVWCYYDTWVHPKTGQGARFHVDECHVMLKRIGTDPQVVEWFGLHRHFNKNVMLITQKFRKVCQDIADSIEILVKVRKATVLGKPNSYIRKVHAGYRGEVISSEIRDYEPQYFGLYRSHTQGNAVMESQAHDVKPFYAKFKRLTLIFWAVTIPGVVWAFWPDSKAKDVAKVDVRQAPGPIELARAPAAPDRALTTPEPQIAALRPAAAASAPVDAPGEMPEPFASKGVHLTGRMTMGGKTVYTFSVSHNAVYMASVTHLDLVKMGYRWTPITDCAGALAWKSTTRAIVCDSPKTVEASLSTN